MKQGAGTVLLVAGLVITSCGGGDSSSPPSGGSPPPPVSSPSPPPSPPPPSISYLKFDELTGDQQFLAGCGNLFGTGGNTSSEGLGTYPGNPEATAHNYSASLSSWEIKGFARDDSNGPEYTYTFGPAEEDATSTDIFRIYRKTLNGFVNEFTITKRALGAMAGQYVRQTRLVAKPGTNVIDIHCVIGVPTVRDDSLPGVISYPDQAISGTAISSSGTRYDLGTSTATFNYQLGMEQFSYTIHLIGREVTSSGISSTSIDLGNYGANGFIIPPDKTFSAPLNSSSGPAGTMGGGFFGPQGVEMGYGFSGSGSASGISFQFGGTVVGRR
ncbi:hypothetical protein [Erythrobacter mangrovi]|uniref:Transferrin-binding protein-like solute binding protein n=1 Tax=Erythrobacter mangrovi TaxID=2739433 RepID=A0A7D4AUK8_9SPHN|nr:hypothetical protein [Erythrobacter mangrovi]QKG71997.1 hypothetical protein HQR01_11815 [Erythrobacter mangrovi]